MRKLTLSSAFAIGVLLLTLSPPPEGLAELWYIQKPSFQDGKSDNNLRLSSSSFAGEDQIQKLDCFPLTLRIDCSSEEIAKARPVICRIEFPGARTDFKPVIEWSVSKGGRKKRSEVTAIEVTLTDDRVAKIGVKAKVTSPRVCLDTVSAELRVVKPRRTQRMFSDSSVPTNRLTAASLP
jgi:hypothetical protein